MKIFYGEMGTKHFTFRAVDTNQPDLEATMARGLRWHCEQAGVPPAPLLQQFYSGAWNCRILEDKVLYRDSWPVGPTGAVPSIAEPPTPKPRRKRKA